MYMSILEKWPLSNMKIPDKNISEVNSDVSKFLSPDNDEHSDDDTMLLLVVVILSLRTPHGNGNADCRLLAAYYLSTYYVGDGRQFGVSTEKIRNGLLALRLHSLTAVSVKANGVRLSDVPF